jgi:protein SCO1
MKSKLLTLAALAIIFIVGILIAFNILKPEEKLKVYRPVDLNPQLVDESLRKSTKPHNISNFELTAQNGKSFSQSDLEGAIYIADFFFTTCPSICPAMSAQMKRIYDAFLTDNDIKLLSHTVMPEVDSPEVLSDYADKYGADIKKWIFLTGDKQIIYELARKSYFAVTTEGNGDEHDFIHTENLILIDKSKRIRGFYDGTDSNDVDRLIKDIEILKKEYSKK